MTPIARKGFVVVEREDVPESKALHIPETARRPQNLGRVVSSGPEVVGLEVDALVAFGLGIQAEIDGLLYMRDDNVLAVMEE